MRDQAFELWLKRLARRVRLSERDRAIIMALPGHVREFGPGRDIVKLGERMTHSCLIAEGVVARFGQTADGMRQFSALYLPGDMGDLHSAVLPRVSAPLQATGPATIISVPHAALIDAAASSDVLARAFWRDCVIDAQIAAEWMLNIARRKASSRLAHLLCELAVRYELIGAPPGTFPMELTQSHLGDALGLTSVHVNRSLRVLREEGLILLRDRVMTIPDWDAMSHRAGFDRSYLHLESVE